jgi:hypothetical protein
LSLPADPRSADMSCHWEDTDVAVQEMFSNVSTTRAGAGGTLHLPGYCTPPPRTHTAHRTHGSSRLACFAMGPNLRVAPRLIVSLAPTVSFPAVSFSSHRCHPLARRGDFADPALRRTRSSSSASLSLSGYSEAGQLRAPRPSSIQHNSSTRCDTARNDTIRRCERVARGSVMRKIRPFACWRRGRGRGRARARAKVYVEEEVAAW